MSYSTDHYLTLRDVRFRVKTTLDRLVIHLDSEECVVGLSFVGGRWYVTDYQEFDAYERPCKPAKGFELEILNFIQENGPP